MDNRFIEADVDHQDVFVVDRVDNKIAEASIRDDGGQADGGVLFPKLAPDGKAVVFMSYAVHVADDRNGRQDIYIVELDEGFWGTAANYVPTLP